MKNAPKQGSMASKDALNAAAMPAPRPEKGGAFKTILMALAAIAILAGASFWLTRAPAQREELRKEAASVIDDVLADTPLAGLGRHFTPQPPPPPPEVISPPTEAGTLSGRQIVGTIAAPMDFGPQTPGQYAQPRSALASEEKPGSFLSELLDAAAAPATRQEPEQVIFSPEPLPPVTEDSTVRPGYVAGLAQWLVGHYRPGANGGSLNVTPQALNQECGVRLAGQAPGGRANLLRYAFHPAMVNGLYHLYVSRFMEDLETAAQNKGLNGEQIQQFYHALAGRSSLLAANLEALLQLPDLSGRLKQIDNMAQQAVDANTELTTAVFEFDELRQAKGAPQVQAAAQMRVSGATARYRRAMEAHTQAQTALANEIRKYGGQGLDSDSLLFMAAWIARREANGSQGREALKSCVQVLRDFSSRCLANQ